MSLIFDIHERDLRPSPLMSGPVRRPPATMPQAAIPTKEKFRLRSTSNLVLDVPIFICPFFSSSQIFIGLTYPGPVLGIIVLVAKFSRVGGVGPDQRGTFYPCQGSLKH